MKMTYNLGRHYGLVEAPNRLKANSPFALPDPSQRQWSSHYLGWSVGAVESLAGSLGSAALPGNCLFEDRNGRAVRVSLRDQFLHA